MQVIVYTNPPLLGKVIARDKWRLLVLIGTTSWWFDRLRVKTLAGRRVK